MGSTEMFQLDREREGGTERNAEKWREFVWLGEGRGKDVDRGWDGRNEGSPRY